jgi:hypothetical protein
LFRALVESPAAIQVKVIAAKGAPELTANRTNQASLVTKQDF